MKTLVKDGRSIYLFEDNDIVSLNSNNIIIGDPESPENLTIADCNNSDTTLYENVTAPEDWFAHRYLFDGITWTINPDWPEDLFEWDGTRWNFIG